MKQSQSHSEPAKQLLSRSSDIKISDMKMIDSGLTPKVFANSSPGLSFGNPGIMLIIKERTLKEFH